MPGTCGEGLVRVDPCCLEEFKNDLPFAAFRDGIEGSGDIVAEVLFREQRPEFVRISQFGRFLEDMSVIGTAIA